jgi:hypothetical protein
MSKKIITINKQTPRQKIVHYDPLGNIRVFSCKELYEAWEFLTQQRDFDLDIVGDDVFDEWECIANEYASQMSSQVILSEPYNRKDGITLRDDVLVISQSVLKTLACQPLPFHLGMVDPPKVYASSLFTKVVDEMAEPEMLGLRESCGECYHRNDVNIEYPFGIQLPIEYASVSDRLTLEFFRATLDLGEVVLSTARPVHWMLAHAVNATISGIPALFCAPQNYYQQLNRRRGILLHTIIMEGRYNSLTYEQLKVLTSSGQSSVFFKDNASVFTEGPDILWVATSHYRREGDYVVNATKLDHMIVVDHAVSRREEYVDYCHCAHWDAHMIRHRPMTEGHSILTQNERCEREVRYLVSRLANRIDWGSVVIVSLIHYASLLRRHSLHVIDRRLVHDLVFRALQRYIPVELVRKILGYDDNSELDPRQAMFGMDMSEDDFLTALPNEIVNVHVGRDSISPTGSEHLCARCFLFVPEDSVRPGMVGIHAPGGLCMWRPLAPKTLALQMQPGNMFYTRYNGARVEQMERSFETTRLRPREGMNGNTDFGS